MKKQSFMTLLNAISDFFEEEKYRLPNFIPMGIGIGICVYFSLSNEPSFLLNCCVFAITVIAFIAHKIWTKQNQDISLISTIYTNVYKNVVNFILSSAFLISLGFLISQIRTMHVNTFMINEDIKKPISFAATIESCEKTEKGLKFIVSDTKRKYDDWAGNLCKKFSKLHLIWIGEKARESVSDYTPGTRVLFRAMLSPIRSQAFPGAYDFRKQQFFKGISARGFVIKPPKILQNCEQPTIKVYIEQLRHKIDKTIEKYLPKHTAAIAKALTTGNTAGITKQVRANFSSSGTAHVLAISGLHIGIIGFFIFWLFRVILCFFPRISMFYDTKKIAAIASWIAVLLYLQISGCSVSSIRAFIMHTIIIIAILLNRTPLTMRSVAIAATIIMLSTPEVIMFPSFQMSFGAVIAIIAYVESELQMPKFLKWLSEVVAVTIIASIPTSIISVSVFNQLTLNSILANIVCIPLMTFFIMPMLMFALFLMIFGMARPIIMLAGYGIDLLAKIAEETAKLPGSLFVMHAPTNVTFGIIIVSFLIFTLIQHKIRFVGLLGIFGGLVLYFIQPLPDIFVSPHAKVVGIRTDDCVCFSHLGYFRSMTDSWSRSVGFGKRHNFKSSACSKFVTKLEDNTYAAKIKGKMIIITNDDKYKNPNIDLLFILNKEGNNQSKIIFLDDDIIKKDVQKIRRPWS